MLPWLSRQPAEGEVWALTKLYETNLDEYCDDPNSAAKLLSVGQAPSPDDVDAAELAAWTAVSRAIFNLNEFISRN